MPTWKQLQLMMILTQDKNLKLINHDTKKETKIHPKIRKELQKTIKHSIKKDLTN